MVEVWLQKLVDGMQGTIKSTIKRAYRNVQEMALEDFIFGHPAQIALLGIQFQWTADTQVGFGCGSSFVNIAHQPRYFVHSRILVDASIADQALCCSHTLLMMPYCQCQGL